LGAIKARALKRIAKIDYGELHVYLKEESLSVIVTAGTFEP
jgi:hypothetical protein